MPGTSGMSRKYKIFFNCNACYLEKKNLSSAYSKLLRAKTHFERVKSLEFPLPCYELLSVLMCATLDFLARRIKTTFAKNVKICCSILGYSP